MKPWTLILGLGWSLLPALSCDSRSRTSIIGADVNDDFDWGIPDDFPLPIVPAENPMSEAKFQLGRHLFYDTRLSGNGSQSCASCHQPEKAFTDGRATALGSTGEIHPRNTMSLTNVAYVPTLTWANPLLQKLESQIMIPLFGENPVEHGLTESNLPTVLESLNRDPVYIRLHADAYPFGETVFDTKKIVESLAVFVRGLVSFDSPYDRFQQGEEQALSASAQRGRLLFFSESLECFHCHGNYNLTNSNADRTMNTIERPFHNTGLFNLGGTGAYPSPNRGVIEVTGRAQDMGKFRAVSLRNIELTAPYMHDGSMASLEDVLAFYAAGGRQVTTGPLAGDGRRNPFKDGFISGFTLDESQKNDLIAFLKSFTDPGFVNNPRYQNPWDSP
jgi:cytochrome c peroxidase